MSVERMAAERNYIISAVPPKRRLFDTNPKGVRGDFERERIAEEETQSIK